VKARLDLVCLPTQRCRCIQCFSFLQIAKKGVDTPRRFVRHDFQKRAVNFKTIQRYPTPTKPSPATHHQGRVPISHLRGRGVVWEEGNAQQHARGSRLPLSPDFNERENLWQILLLAGGAPHLERREGMTTMRIPSRGGLAPAALRIALVVLSLSAVLGGACLLRQHCASVYRPLPETFSSCYLLLNAFQTA
jgi:hypothetical protein